MELYLYRADQETGPYTEVEARALVASSQITRSCPAWHEGMSEWLPLEQVVSLPKPPSSSVATGLPPVPPRRPAQTRITVASPPVAASSPSTIRTASGIIALILGLLAIFNIGGCMNAHAKLTTFQGGNDPMDAANVFVDSFRGANEGDPLRGLAGLMEKGRSLRDDYEGFQLGAWLCVVGTAVAGGVCAWSNRTRAVR